MKKFFVALISFFALIVITSCNSPLSEKSYRENGLKSGFESDVKISLDKLNVTGRVKRLAENTWEAEFSEPSSLSGVRLEFSEGNVKASYKGLDFSVPQSALPVKSMMLNLISAVEENALKDELNGTEKDGRLEISGTLDSGDYILTVDREGKISTFAMDNNKLFIAFSEVKEIQSLPQGTEIQSLPQETETRPFSS